MKPIECVHVDCETIRLLGQLFKTRIVAKKTTTSFHMLNSKFEVIDNLIIMYTNADCYLNKMSEVKLILSTLTVSPT